MKELSRVELQKSHWYVITKYEKVDPHKRYKHINQSFFSMKKTIFFIDVIL